METEQEKYFNQNKKIYMYQLNYTDENTNKKKQFSNLQNIIYKFNNKQVLPIDNVNNPNVIVDDVNSDSDYEPDDVNSNYEPEDNIKLEEKNQLAKTINNELFHLNIEHLDDNNEWKNNSNMYYSDEKESEFIKSVKSVYLDESNELKKDCDSMYKIISETQKIKLSKGIGGSESNEKFISTTELNKNKLYSGITNIIILTDSSKYIIESVKITAKAKNSESNNNVSNVFRDIEWELEFEECDEGYNILGLDNFIHIGLVGLEEIYFDITYKKNTSNQTKQDELAEITEIAEIADLDESGWLKFSRCYYNNIIRTNLEKNLYLNEESYSVDIVDWIYTELINIDLEEKKFGHIYGTNYNILRIMSGMGGLAFSN